VTQFLGEGNPFKEDRETGIAFMNGGVSQTEREILKRERKRIRD
jgi:hypothetical protein